MRGIYVLRPAADTSPVDLGTTLRHLRPPRFRKSRKPASVEVLTLRIAELVAERQQLRAGGSGPAALEQNRIQIARAQWELGHALIDRHLPDTAARPAA